MYDPYTGLPIPSMGIQGLQFPSPSQPQPQPQPQQAPRMDIPRVNGVNGAQAFQIGPNSSVLLLDTTAPLVWAVQTDSAGYKTCSPYDISPHKVEAPVKASDLKEQLEEFNERITKLEERMSGNGQPYNSGVVKKQPNNGGNQPNDRNGQGG